MKLGKNILIGVILIFSIEAFSFFGPMKSMMKMARQTPMGIPMKMAEVPMQMAMRMAMGFCGMPMAGPMAGMFNMAPIPGKENVMRKEMMSQLRSRSNGALLKSLSCAKKNREVTTGMLKLLREEQYYLRRFGDYPWMLARLGEKMEDDSRVAVSMVQLAVMDQRVSKFLFTSLNKTLFENLVLAVNRNTVRDRRGEDYLALAMIHLFQRHMQILGKSCSGLKPALFQLDPQDLGAFMMKMESSGQTWGMSEGLQQFFQQMRAETSECGA